MLRVFFSVVFVADIIIGIADLSLIIGILFIVTDFLRQCLLSTIRKFLHFSFSPFYFRFYQLFLFKEDDKATTDRASSSEGYPLVISSIFILYGMSGNYQTCPKKHARLPGARTYELIVVLKVFIVPPTLLPEKVY